MTDIISQKELVFEFYVTNPNRDIKHEEVVDWLTREYKERTGKTFRDPDRAIRKLHPEGSLIKVSKGIYRYDPNHDPTRKLEDFTVQQRKEIFQRDEYKCVICGRGLKDGVDIHADHIKPKDKGGKADISNGQTLCAEHNFQKKNYNATETGKRMFIRLSKVAEKAEDEKITNFCREVLELYKKHHINGHIEWDE